MSWRIVVISKAAKLDYKLDYLIVRQEETIKIHLSEISVLMIESTAVSITAYLLNELMKRKIKVIFCDEKRNPSSELIPYYGSHDTSAKIRTQIHWNDKIKTEVWTSLVTEKIRKQAGLLQKYHKPESSMLFQYAEEVQLNDSTNREGHAAKVYFNALFGKDFSRSIDHPFNSALNYGYGLLLSACNREIASNGYLTQLGLFHDNMFNPFNFGSDLMEPFRIIVDEWVYENQPDSFDHEIKMALVDLLNKELILDDQKQYLNNIIKIYCRSVFDALNEQDISLIRFYHDEL